MVLVDTSVWIRFLADRAPWAAQLEAMLDQEEAAGHNLVYGELLVGDPSGRRDLLDSYGLMPVIPEVRHAEVVTFVRANSIYGRGIGWVDAHLLASCLVATVPLWTADERLDKVADELGISYGRSGRLP
jgi:predicted nucleic acid-binding protein